MFFELIAWFSHYITHIKVVHTLRYAYVFFNRLFWTPKKAISIRDLLSTYVRAYRMHTSRTYIRKSQRICQQILSSTRFLIIPLCLSLSLFPLFQSAGGILTGEISYQSFFPSPVFQWLCFMRTCTYIPYFLFSLSLFFFVLIMVGMGQAIFPLCTYMQGENNQIWVLVGIRTYSWIQM